MNTKKKIPLKNKQLKKQQIEVLLTWISEGLRTDEINQRASKFKPAFKTTRQQVDHYRKTRGVNIKKIILSGQEKALKEGLSLKASRVKLLQEIADKLMTDLLIGNKLWLLQVKGIGSYNNYERVEYYEFNTGEVQQLRGVLDDIAKELGERGPDVKVENNNFFTKMSDDQLKQFITSRIGATGDGSGGG